MLRSNNKISGVVEECVDLVFAFKNVLGKYSRNKDL